jgi:hypothetical protein
MKRSRPWVVAAALAAALLASTSMLAAALTCEWVAAGGGESHDKTRAVATDAQGHVFLASECVGDARFGDQLWRSAGGMDMCLIKVGAEGKPLWVAGLGGSKTDRAYGVICDAHGNAYVTGHFESGDLMVHGKPLANAGSYDAFTAKFSAAGDVLWVRSKGGADYDYGHGIAIDSKGAVVVTGAIGRKIFCTKYDAEGNEVWHRSGEGALSGSGHGIAVDGRDEIVIGGNSSGSGSWGKLGIASKTTAALALKLNPQGEALWVSLIEGSPSALYHEITCDALGRVWGAGMFKGRLSVAGQTFSSSGEKDNDGLMVHLDAKGQVQWARHLKGVGTDYCLGVATDGSGRSYFCGDFNQATSLAGHSLTPRGSGDIFVAGFDERGGLSWVEQAGGKLNDSAYPLIYAASGHLICAGSFGAPASFGKVEVTGGGKSDLYAAKWRLPRP